MKHFLTSSFLLFVLFEIAAQCPVTATATPATVCSPAGLVTLRGTAGGGTVLSTEWQPDFLVANPSALVTTANVSVPTTFIFEARVQTTNDVIQNGDFSAGNSGFSSDLTFVPPGPGLIVGGTYTLFVSPQQVSAMFPPCDDHSPGMGNMLGVNGSNSSGVNVWCQTVSVNPTSDYLFTMYVLSFFSPTVANLNVYVNGVQLGNTFSPSSTFCVWNEFQEIWESDGSSSVEICIENQTGGAFGPFFAFDDISFIEICKDTAQAHVDVIEVEATIFPPDDLDCLASTVLLDGSASTSGANISYQWKTIDGNIVAGDDEVRCEVDEPGQYTLTVTYDDGAGTICEDFATVRVEADRTPPVVRARSADSLNCDVVEVQLDGTGSSINGDLTYLWETDDGNIVRGENSLFPIVNAPGVYTFTIVNNDNNCWDSVWVRVFGDTVRPVALIVPPDSLTCQKTSVMLNGQPSSSGSQITFLWRTATGNFLSDTTKNQVTVDTLGVYSLIVTNRLNQCRDTATVEVNGKYILPQISIKPPDSLTCDTRIVVLDGSNSAKDSIFRFTWSTLNGHFFADSTTLTPKVDVTGVYVLTIIDTTTNCQSRLSISVRENTQPPVAEAGVATTFLCSTDSLPLNGNGSSLGSRFVYNWTSQNGRLLRGSDSLTPFIGSAGDYFLTVKDTLNGCQSSDTVTVLQDAAVPYISVLEPDTLTCTNGKVRLDASASDSVANYSVVWSTTSGHILGSPNSRIIEVDAPGEYVFSIENSQNGCQNSRSVLVERNTEIPDFQVFAGGVLDCRSSEIQLDVNLIAPISNFNFEWTTMDGNFLNGQNSLTPTVDKTGTYQLEISSLQNGCASVQNVEVQQDRVAPDFQISLPAPLTCIDSVELLDVVIQNFQPDFHFEWLKNGVFFSNLLNPQVSQNGAYRLTVLDNGNGCESAATVLVEENKIEPEIALVAQTGDTLNCKTQEVELVCVVNNLNPNDCLFDWDQPFLPDVQTAPISIAGTYSVEVIYPVSGCITTATILIFEDFQAPMVEAGLGGELNCLIDSFQLDATGSSVGAAFAYAWSTIGGNFQSPTNILTPTVNAAGAYFIEVLNTRNGCSATDSVLISKSADIPTAIIARPDTLTCLQKEVVLDASTSSAGNNFSYSWTTADGQIKSGANSLLPTVEKAGTYLLRIFNSDNSCEALTSVKVEENTIAPRADAGTSLTLDCNNSAISLDGGGSDSGAGYQLQWFTLDGQIFSGETTLFPIVGKAGTYVLTVENLRNGCSDTSQIIVNEDFVKPQSQPEPVNEITCRDSMVAIQVNLPDNNANYLFQWLTANGNFQNQSAPNAILANRPGDYQVIVEKIANGCRDTVDFLVNEDRQVPNAVANASDKITCRNRTVAVSGNGSDTGVDFQYLWTTNGGLILNGANTLNAQVGLAGRYFLEVENVTNGCKSMTFIDVMADTVQPLLTFLTPDTLTCDRLSVMINSQSSMVQNPVYFWDTPDGNISGNADLPFVVVDAPGTYQLQVTNTDNGCSSLASVEVVLDNNPPTIVIAPPQELTCSVQSIALDATGSSSGSGYAYRWRTNDGQILSGGTSLTPTILGSGTYVLTITNIFNGCETVDSVVVSDNPDILTDATVDFTAPTCANPGGSISISNLVSGVGPFQYSIDNGLIFSDSANFNNLAAGTYEIVVRDSNGCKIMRTITIPVIPPVDVSLTPEIQLNIGQSAQVQTILNIPPADVVSVIWTPTNGMSCTDCLNPTVTGVNSQIYSVVVTDVNGCVDSASFSLIVSQKLDVYIPNSFSPNDDGANDWFYVLGVEGTVVNIRKLLVFDRWGNELFSTTDIPPNVETVGWNGSYKGKKMDSGVYVFFAEVEFVTGVLKLYEGDVSLVR